MSVQRFWCSRDGGYTLDSHGFLEDPEASRLGGRSANPGVLHTEDLIGNRCLVLLGEPGAGKSTAVTATAQLVTTGVPVTSVDLAAYGSEDRLVREVFDDPSILAWSAAGAGQLCLVLDSLDEARARVPHIGAVIADRVRRLPYERMYLRIACRTADWPEGLERSLEELFGEVAVVEILPLRRADVSAIATAWCDPSLFLEEVAKAGAGPLAARPLTLRFLARSFAESGTLPERGAQLYATGIRFLCGEANIGRMDAGLGGALSLDQRVAVARRIAATTVFGGATSIWTGSEVDASGDDITVRTIAGKKEPTPSGTVDVTASAVQEAARSGLFTSRGGQRLGWAHATFADFLAAEWVVTNKLSATQARPLFLGPDGRCWPQTRLAAVWTVAIAPERFEFLTKADPAAFQGEVELPGDALRAAVIDGLFAVASTLTTAPWERSYHALRHRDIVDQLRGRLRDSDADRRRLALELADECAASELREDLTAIAADRNAEMRERVAAGWALTRLPEADRTEALRALALDSAERGDDPTDELKGVALMASWPHALSNVDVFSVLTPHQQRNYRGAYAIFVDRFRQGITEADIDAGLQWLLGDLNGPEDDSDLAALANRVLQLAATRPTDDAVVNAFTRVALARAKHYDGLLFQDYRDEHEDPLADPALRRAIAAAVLAADSTSAVTYRLTGDGPYSFGIVRADDLAWLAEQYVDANHDVRGALRSLFQWTFNIGVAAHRELVLDMASSHPLHRDLVHAWVDPVALDSPEASQMRQSWEMFKRPRRAKKIENDDVDGQIEKLLARFDNGEAVGFWQSMRLLTVAPGSKPFRAEDDSDVVGMPRWPTLNDELRERIVDAAERYLRSHPCQAEQWLDKPEIRFYPAEAGYRAMVLLLKVAPERLRRLPAAAWMEWAPVLAGTSTAFVNGAAWEDKVHLLDLAGPETRDAARAALLARVHAAASAGRPPFASNEASYLWNDTIAARYFELARSTTAEPRVEIITSLAKHDLDLLRKLLLEWLVDPTDSDRQRLAAETLIGNDLERSWPALKAAFDADLELAEQALGRSLTVRGDEKLDDVPAAVLADIYSWLRSKFPPESDPQFDDVHIVGPREQIGQWRDSLLYQLRDEGSLEAVEEIRALVASLPSDRWLARTLATAEAALRRNQWIPTPLPHLLQLAGNRRTILVNDTATLAEAITSAVADIQTRLTGGTPESHYLWDTYAGRPKSEDEISDYLANELSRILSDHGVVVSREVQIRRNQPSGIGERTDLLVDATPVGGSSSGRLTVPIEVKGAWNHEVFTSMSDQLVERYMRDTSAKEGVFIVAWPDLRSWTDTADKRRAAVASLDRGAVEAELAIQASALTRGGARVSVAHLNIDYRRPS